MNIAIQKIMSLGNGSIAKTIFGSRSAHGSLLALSAGAVLLSGNVATLAGPCTIQIVQFERQIAINSPIQ